MQSFRELPLLFLGKSGQENPHRTLLSRRLVPPKILLAAIMIGIFFMLSSSAALADTGASPSPSDDRVYCAGAQCDNYKAAQTHCIDDFGMLQDEPIYDGVGRQIGSLRLWYSVNCKTYWPQIFSSNCASIDQFEVGVQVSQGPEIGLDGGCSLSGHMYYDPDDPSTTVKP